jgi:hypothetical protein
MATAGALPHLAPRELLEDASVLDLLGFLTRHGDAPLLLVRVPQGDTEFELGLHPSEATSGTGKSKVSGPFPFQTGLVDPHAAARRAMKTPGQDAASLRHLLDQHSYCAVPVCKREETDALFMGRISVGRARNKDIVLRHSSVSKFHAWIEANESETLHVADAGSTNLTQVNGRPLEPRIRTELHAGDSIRFGAIETVLCTPETLWNCLHLNHPRTAST